MKNCIFFAAVTVALMCSSSGLNAQTIYTYAGTGVPGYSGDGGAATTAQINESFGVAADAAGNVYFTDYNNHRIRKIDPSGVVTTIAGTGFGGFMGDGGPATAAWIRWPKGITLDGAGNIYFADFGNNCVRKINSSGIISTIGGVPMSTPGSVVHEGGPATADTFGNVWGIAIDASGNVLVADELGHRVRHITPSGTINTVAGIGFAGFTGDGGAATAARLNGPTGVAVDGAGNIFVADNANNRVRKVSPTGTISTIAGTGIPYGYTGDGGPATIAKLYYPKGIAVDGPGNVYITDWNNNCVRRINTSGIISTLTGSGSAGYAGDGGPAASGVLDHPTAVTVRTDGDLFISDDLNHRLRHIKVGNEPYFVRGESASASFCAIEFLVLDSLLGVDDIDVGQTETWSVAMSPAHGTLTAAYATISTGSTVSPSTITYAPSSGYTGPDSFKVRVNDGTASDTITIYVTVIAPPVAGTISGQDSVCPGYATTLTDPAPGGVWSSSDISLATVSGGVVSGVSPGTVTISYSVSNECGIAVATYDVRVLATVPCFSGLEGFSTGAGLQVMPNPAGSQISVFVPGITGHAHVSLTGITGNILNAWDVSVGQTTFLNIDVPGGVYLICADNGVKSWRKRIVVIE